MSRLYRFAPIFIAFLMFSCSSDSQDSNENTIEDGDDISNEDEIVIEEDEVLDTPESILDYSSMENWAFHPDQAFNLLSVYDLNIGIVDKDLNLEGSISIENNADTNTGVDVFFVHPTILDNSPNEATVIALEDQPSTRIDLTIIAQGGQLAKYGRFFAPRYRQSTGFTYLNENVDKVEQAEVVVQTYSDIKAAFLNYLNNYNNGNKIILAGHSQGSFLLSMLLSDFFDDDSSLRDKLVTAALGGMSHIYAAEGTYVGGQFENISLCLQAEDCGCVQGWRSYKEGQTYNDTRNTLPMFNDELVKYGLFNRTVDPDTDWYVMDESYITQSSTPFRYIVLSSNVKEDHGYNFVAHDNLYTARMRRDSNTDIGLNVAFVPEEGDQRINDLAVEEEHILFDFWGYHTKDYAIYLWPLLQQIDAKLANCN